jgi:hypothetical protein
MCGTYRYAGVLCCASAYRDQELSRLFFECEWTQERIAAKVGKSKAWVCRQLAFGTFLNSLPTGQQNQKPLESLTERRFRRLSKW